MAASDPGLRGRSHLGRDREQAGRFALLAPNTRNSEPKAHFWRQTCGIGLIFSGAAVVLAGFVLDPAPDLIRKGLAELLLEVPHEPDRARHDGQPAAYLPGDLELAQDRADGARGVDRELAGVGAGGLDAHLLDQLDV